MLPKNLFKKPKNDLESYDKYTKSPAPDIPSELCISCPECKAMLFTSELNENLDVCPPVRPPKRGEARCPFSALQKSIHGRYTPFSVIARDRFDPLPFVRSLL